MTLPRISIITPSFNQAAFLEETIRSVLSQGYPNLEYGVIDGGSTDGSAGIIERYRDRLAFAVVEPDRGQSHAINKGLARATGQIVGWLNSDDVLLPGALNSVGDYFASHPETDWIIGHALLTDARGRPTGIVEPTGDFTLYGALARKCPFMVPQPASFWRADLLHRVGLLDESLHYCMDFDLWCRFLAAGARPATLSQPLATYRLHDTSKSFSQSDDFPRALIEIEKRYSTLLPLHQRLNVQRLIGYQTRAVALHSATARPWNLVLRRPWWLGSRQVLGSLIHGPATGRAKAA